MAHYQYRVFSADHEVLRQLLIDEDAEIRRGFSENASIVL